MIYYNTVISRKVITTEKMHAVLEMSANLYSCTCHATVVGASNNSTFTIVIDMERVKLCSLGFDIMLRVIILCVQYICLCNTLYPIQRSYWYICMVCTPRCKIRHLSEHIH